MIFDSLNIAASSLKSQQKAMDVISHNIANVNTPGYSRQTTDLVTVSPDRIGGLNFGRGVDVNAIRRSVDPLISQAQLVNGSQQGFWNEISTGLNSVENVFGSLSSTGLASALDEFFLSWQQLANNPQDAALKLNVRTKSATVGSSISGMQQQLSAARLSADASIDQGILQANSLLDQIASLSAQIQRQEVGGQGVTGVANDLRDQRDQAVRELSAFLPVQQISTPNGGFLLQTAGGDLLVQDDVARHLGRGASAAGGFSDIVIRETNATVSGLDQGGSLGGLIELRDNRLGGYLASLDSIARNLIFSVNQLQASGASATPATSFTAGQPSNAALPLNDPAQSAPFAAQIVSGSFTLHVHDAAGNATPPGGTAINVVAGVTTMNDIAAQINAIAGVSASIDASGRLSIAAAAGGSIALGADSSNVLAAYEINTLFAGGDAASIRISDAVSADASVIATGRVDPLTSSIQAGDNAVALDILNLQNTALSIDGSPAASLHERTASLSTQYGNDVATAAQQLQYRTAEADSLNAQRQAFSGVNVDEELVTMIKYQRAYEAAAKVISTTNQMLDSLLGLIR